jgi:hypothetical protein
MGIERWPIVRSKERCLGLGLQAMCKERCWEMESEKWPTARSRERCLGLGLKCVRKGVWRWELQGGVKCGVGAIGYEM